MKYILLFFALSLGFSLNANSQETGDILTAEANGISFKFKLLNDGTLGLVGNDYSGNIVVPESVEIDGAPYIVTAICGENDDDEKYYAGDNIELAFAFSEKRECSIVLPETLVYIGEGAFFNAAVTELKIPNSVSYVGRMFDLDMLKTLVLPDSQEATVSYAINKFDSLESIVFGKNLKSIDTPLLVNTFNLKSLRFQTETPPVLIKDPFDQCGIWDLSKITVFVPKGCVNAYKEAWPDFEFTYKEYGTTGISSDDIDNIDIMVVDKVIYISNVSKPTEYELYDISGILVCRGNLDCGDNTVYLSDNSSVFILKIGSVVYKVGNY